MGDSGIAGDEWMKISKCLTMVNLEAYYITLNFENLIMNDKDLIKETMRSKRRDKVLWRKRSLKI